MTTPAAGGAPGSLTERLFLEAARSHHAGKLADAERCYRELLRIDPRHVQAHYYLGIVALQTGRAAMTVEAIGRAVAQNDREPD